MNLSIVYILILAALPFLAKIGVVFLGLTGYIAQSFYKVFQLLIPALWRYREGERGANIFWPSNEPFPSWKVWAAGTLISVALSAAGITALTLLLPFWHLDPQVIRDGFDARFSVGPVTAVLVVIFLAFINSALEELHFRAWLDRVLSQRAGDTVGIAISSVAFASMHGLIFLGLPGFSPSLIAMAVLGLVICGICWSFLTRKPGGIHAAWWSHGLTDALLLGWGLHWLGYV